MIWLLLSALVFAGDGPEISSSKGKKTEIVVLYPRVTPPTDDAAIHALAAQVQQRMQARAAATGRIVNLRPAPERVCPKSTGCKAPSVGAVLVHEGGGCAVVATATRIGQSPSTLVSWAGKLELAAPTVGFREPAEALVTVHDFAPCADLEAALGGADATVDEAIKAALVP